MAICKYCNHEMRLDDKDKGTEFINGRYSKYTDFYHVCDNCDGSVIIRKINNIIVNEDWYTENEIYL